MKRDSVSAYVHVRCDTPYPLYAAVHILDDVPSSSVAQVLNGFLIA